MTVPLIEADPLNNLHFALHILPAAGLGQSAHELLMPSRLISAESGRITGQVGHWPVLIDGAAVRNGSGFLLVEAVPRRCR